jgi:hypothetical protein
MAAKAHESMLTPLVAQGRALLAEAEAIKLERDAIALRLKEKDAELTAINDQLIALGTGRYRDEENHTAVVVAAIEATLSADSFVLRSKEDEAAAREIADDKFLKLFDRHVTFAPKDGFAAIANALLTPAKARDIVALTIVPGQFTGGRRAYVRWK